MIRIKQNTKLGYVECFEGGAADLTYPSSKTRRGRVVNHGKIVPTLCAKGIINRLESEHRIRVLTPLEYWRFMDFSEVDFYEASKVSSNTRLYEQAGNSICRNVLCAIFMQMGIQDIERWNDVR